MESKFLEAIWINWFYGWEKQDFPKGFHFSSGFERMRGFLPASYCIADIHLPPNG
jgi:hypothetical protein